MSNKQQIISFLESHPGTNAVELAERLEMDNLYIFEKINELKKEGSIQYNTELHGWEIKKLLKSTK